jgi:hypothetical protein
MDDSDLSDLLRALPPAPAPLVLAAKQLVRTRRVMDDVLARMERDAAFRAAATRDLERALDAAGIELDETALRALRERLER